jgi:hypothetical protein
MLLTGNSKYSANRRGGQALGSLRKSNHTDKRIKFANEFMPGPWNNRKYRSSLASNSDTIKNAKSIVAQFLVNGDTLT